MTKFAYLTELVDPRVRAEIDGLPFTTEGYERAKNILIGEYGKTSEIINAYVQNLANLPVITGTQPAPIHKKLVYNVQSLETLGKLKDVTGNARSVLDELKGVKADLVRGEIDWQDWDSPRLIKALKSWKEINPIVSGTDNAGKQGAKFRDREKNISCKRNNANTKRVCLLWHGDPRKELGLKQLCFNSTGSRHRAAECKCPSGYQICSQTHHTSICYKPTSRDQLMTTTSVERIGVVYPMVTVDVNGVKCRALLDTGAGSSHASGPFPFPSSPSTIQVHWNDVWYFKQSGRHLWPTNSKRRWEIQLGSWSKQSRPQRVVDIGKPKMRRNRSSVFSFEGRNHKW